MIGRRQSLSGLRVASLRPKGQTLPFTISLVRTHEQLAEVVKLRALSYGRHVPELGKKLEKPEALDFDKEVVLFIAQSKGDGATIGTIRGETNFSRPLTIESSIELPDFIQGRAAIGVSRLAIVPGGRGRIVKLALIKALYRYCLAKQVEYVVIGARPPVDRTYVELGFLDVFEDRKLRPLRSAADVPHRVLYTNVFTAERVWYERKHPLYEFMGLTYHPDIEIFSSVSNMWTNPRTDSAAEFRPDFLSDLPVV